MYQEMYKCRLCGKTFVGEELKERYLADIACSLLEAKDFSTHAGRNWMKCKKHCCQDGSYGLADFQGFKKSEVSKNE